MEKYNDLIPEDVFGDHVSVINKNTLHEYLKSTERDSNVSSLLLLNDVWKQSTELYSKNADGILKSAKAITQNVDTSKGLTMKSSLNTLCDALVLFEESLTANCTKCQPNIACELCPLTNNQCTCSLDIKPTQTACKDTQNIKRLPYKVKPLHSDSLNDDESKSGAEQRQIFKPKFGKPWPKTDHSNIPTSSSASYPDIELVKGNDRFSYKKHQTYDVDLEKEDEDKSHRSNVTKITFKTAKEQLLASNPAAKRTLGTSRKAQAKFVSPMIGAQDKQETAEPEVTDERLKHIDPKMIELIESEIIDKGNPIGWDDIAGLQMAKSVIQEAVVWPLLRPDIFTGLRRPPKGILLFGPPGTGKTLIGKCVAAQCNATFFSISASSLTSKWIGDGEKMVRALFAVARCHQPAVIFIDEIDSLLTQRNDTEHEATRRIKTEFLVQFDGAATGDEDRLLIVGATNRPQELDEAARRRLVKRLYIPLPDADARKQIITNLLKSEHNELTPQHVAEVAALTDGFSGADMKSLCSEAAMGPIRAVPLSQIISIQRDKVRPVHVQDFKTALQRVRPSVSQDDLGQYVKWNKTYGQGF